MKKHAVLLVMASALSFVSIAASAKVTIVSCEGCSQSQEEYAAAQELNKENTNPTAPARGNIYVGNNGVIHKYSVFVENRVDPPHCKEGTCTQPQRVAATVQTSGMPQWSATPMSVESSVQAAFDNMMAFYNAAPVGWVKHYTLKIVVPGEATSADEGIALNQRAMAFAQSDTPVVVPVLNYPDPRINAYDVVNRGAVQQQFLDYLRSVPSGQISSVIDHLAQIAAAVNMVNYKEVPSIVVEVVFSDKSSVDAIMEKDTSLNRFSIIPDTAVDSNHNPIPATKAVVQGTGISKYVFNTYDSNGTDALNMFNQISELGVPISPDVTVGNAKNVGYINCYQGSCHVVWYNQQ